MFVIVSFFVPGFSIDVEIDLGIIQIGKEGNELLIHVKNREGVSVSDTINHNLYIDLDAMSLTIISQLFGVLDSSHQFVILSLHNLAM